jgi:outer membrane protein assembly factor BamB
VSSSGHARSILPEIGRLDSHRAWSRSWGSCHSGLAATNASLPFVDGDLVWLGFSSVVVPFDAATGKPDLTAGFTTGRNALGTPTATLDAVAFGNLDGHLYVHDSADGRVRWSFEPGPNPAGGLLQVYGFALEGDRLIVRTQAGYYGLAQDDAATEPVEFGTALRSTSEAKDKGAE